MPVDQHQTVSFFISLIDSVSSAFRSVVFANVLAPFGVTGYSLPFIVFVLLFGSIFFTIRLGFVNIRCAVHATKLLLDSGGGHGGSSEKDGDKISPLKALFVALGGAAGLGNISGVSIAIAAGGPGAAFWMCMTPLITMPLRFAEVFLCHKYRIPKGSGFIGGPCQYMKIAFKELGWAKFGVFLSFSYAILLFIASFGGGCSFQMNQVVQVLAANIDVLHNHDIAIASVMTVIIAVVIFGGVKRIANFISSVVPTMISVYFLSCVVVMIANYQRVWPSLLLIWDSAFKLQSVYGSILGVFTLGFTRIIIANETGLGTAGIIHSNSSNTVSAKEAMISMASPFIDTFFVCIMSALVVIVTGVYQGNYAGIVMTTKAFSTVSPWFHYIVIAMVPFMGLNVLIAWSYYGLRNWQYFAGVKLDKVYLFLYIMAAFVGGIVSDVSVIIRLADVVNTSVAIPNVIAVVLLSGMVVKGLNRYMKDLEKGR